MTHSQSSNMERALRSLEHARQLDSRIEPLQETPGRYLELMEQHRQAALGHRMEAVVYAIRASLEPKPAPTPFWRRLFR